MSGLSKIVFNKPLKELRFILCQTSESSKGAREFIQKYYISLKTANPNIPILIRECSNVEPKIFARYDRGVELKAFVSGESSDSILKRVVDFSRKNG